MIQKDLIISKNYIYNSPEYKGLDEIVIGLQCNVIIKRDDKFYEVPVRMQIAYMMGKYVEKNFWDVYAQFMQECMNVNEKWKLTGEFEKEIKL